DLDGGKATFEKLATSGGDATLVADGLAITVQNQPRLEFAPIFGKVSLKVEDAFAQKPEGKTLRSLADMGLGSSKGKDGAYQLQVFGTLGHPQARPATP
ncbi:MAG TPA: type II secretion system protein GspN, partial [Anaeromyxobacteraceae bacterium]